MVKFAASEYLQNCFPGQDLNLRTRLRRTQPCGGLPLSTQPPYDPKRELPFSISKILNEEHAYNTLCKGELPPRTITDECLQ